MSVWHLHQRQQLREVSMKKQAPCNSQDQKQVEAYYRNVGPSHSRK
jgi:hypothetical protein